MVWETGSTFQVYIYLPTSFFERSLVLYIYTQLGLIVNRHYHLLRCVPVFRAKVACGLFGRYISTVDLGGAERSGAELAPTYQDRLCAGSAGAILFVQMGSYDGKGYCFLRINFHPSLPLTLSLVTWALL